MAEFDFVVVGAGIVGSWTAVHLKQHGRVLLLEQFREPHSRGSSHGQTRLFRSAYSEMHFAGMMPHAHAMWRAMEDQTGEQLLRTTGVLCFAPSPEDEEYRKSAANMESASPGNLVEMSAEEVTDKYRGAVRLSSDTAVFMDKTGGVLYAHKAVRVLQQRFRDMEGEMWDSCPVTQLLPLGDSQVKVICARGEVFAKAVVVCAGPWVKKLLSPQLLPDVPLEPQVVKVFYWRAKKDGVYSVDSGFPAVLSLTPPSVYSLPCLEYPGLMKVCVHGGTPCDPDRRDQTTFDSGLERFVREKVAEHFPMLETEPAILETCMYTCTPDETFVIDRLPSHPNIFVGTGFSGTGFKTSPVVGKLLSELARGVEPFLDLRPFRISRFLSH